MPILSRLCRGTLVLGLIASTAAHADVTPDQAAALQKQLHDWVAGVVGPGIDVPPLPLRFSPEGDHYRVQADVAGTFAGSGVTIEGEPWTATVHPLEGNRWAIDNMKLPSPLKVINAGGPPGMQGNFTLRIAEQENHSIFDPALATTSSSDGRVRGLSQTTETSLGKQSTEVAQMVWHQSLQPTDGGRQNLVMESTLEGYASNQPTKEGPPVSIAIERMRQTGHADAIDFARVGTMIRGFVALGRLASDTGRKPDSKMTPAERDLVRSVAGALSDALTLVDGEQTMEGVRIKAAGFSGKIAKLAMGFGFGAPKGESEIHLRLAMDGIELAGRAARRVPRHRAAACRNLAAAVRDSERRPGAADERRDRQRRRRHHEAAAGSDGGAGEIAPHLRHRRSGAGHRHRQADRQR